MYSFENVLVSHQQNMHAEWQAPGNSHHSLADCIFMIDCETVRNKSSLLTVDEENSVYEYILTPTI